MIAAIVTIKSRTLPIKRIGLDHKRLMITTHLARMVIVCLLPFVTQVWQIYVIVHAR